MVKVVWTQFAIDDLKQIHEFITKDSKAYADRVVDQIILRTEQLQELPLSGRLVPKFQSEVIRE